jgi:hypothetical protein
MSAAPQLDPTSESPLNAQESVDSVVTEYATRGVRRKGRHHLKIVAPLRPERASRGVFALVITGALGLGLVGMLLINTTVAQGAYTLSELKGQQRELNQALATLTEQVEAVGAPAVLEANARALGMVPSETPVFIEVPDGRILGKPKAAPGQVNGIPVLATPADATASEAVDNISVGTDLPIAPGENYDPAAADAAANEAAQTAAIGEAGVKSPKGAAGKKAKGEDALWREVPAAAVISQGQSISIDGQLDAVPVE